MIKLKEMKPGIRYIVVKGGSTLLKGDHVYLSLRDNALMCKEAKGWLLQEQWERLRNLVEVDKDFYEKEVSKHSEALKALDKMLEQD